MGHNINLFRIKKDCLWQFKDFFDKLIKQKLDGLNFSGLNEKIMEKPDFLNKLISYLDINLYLKLRIYEYEGDYLISLLSKSDYYLNHFYQNEVLWKMFIIEYIRTQNHTPQDDIDKKYDFLVAWLEERIFNNHFLTVKVINRFILEEYILEKIFNLKSGKNE